MPAEILFSIKSRSNLPCVEDYNIVSVTRNIDRDGVNDGI